MSAKVIMIQGTTSNAGKSFLTAGLCRIFHQDGYRVAPFKSQNMALNSYITEEGLEIGRAQAMQAEAAGIEATADMNPVLLKPTSDQGSQIIVHGEVRGNQSAMEYYRNKQKLVPEIMEAYHRLEEKYDIIVVEGAGSPAEINLKVNDIVNMGLAAMIHAPVLLVGDIDRGGVFASLYGTVSLLEPEEQKRIKGLIINKFRGDMEILKPGITMIEEKTGIPVVGTIPVETLDLDEEDSLSQRLSHTRPGAGINIAVVRLPHISNFTDFFALERIDQVTVYYVSQRDELGHPDLIILPGTKNTLGDMKWLRESGLEPAILRLSHQKVPVWGICGGFQMLGKEIVDPCHSEGGGIIRGMGLLDASTEFTEEKTRTRMNGIWVLPFSGLCGSRRTISGYEIHMGCTRNLGGCLEHICLEDGRMDGFSNQEQTVFGTYLHGFFDGEGVAEAVISSLDKGKGMGRNKIQNEKERKEEQYNRLAELIRRNCHLDQIYRILEGGEDL